jgi:hypothetical protein
MTPHSLAAPFPARKSLPCLLARGDRRLSCDVVARGRQRFDVCVIPHWDRASSVVEQFSSASQAARRQAELSWFFRQTGWQPLLGR